MNSAPVEVVEEVMPQELASRIKELKLSEKLKTHLLLRTDFAVIEELLDPKNQGMLLELDSALNEA